MSSAGGPDPYGAFNFRLTIDGVALGGFSEVTGLGAEVTVAEYRAGNDKARAARKIAGMHKTAEITLKRGLIRSGGLYDWQGAVRDGRDDAARTVEITLLDEAGKAVMVWNLVGARPLKFTGPALKSDGNDVAVEELVLATDGLERLRVGARHA